MGIFDKIKKLFKKKEDKKEELSEKEIEFKLFQNVQSIKQVDYLEHLVTLQLKIKRILQIEWN